MRSAFERRLLDKDCSHRVTQGPTVYFTNSKDCCSIFENVDFSRSPIICGARGKCGRFHQSETSSSLKTALHWARWKWACISCRVGKCRRALFPMSVCTSLSPNRAYTSRCTRLSIYTMTNDGFSYGILYKQQVFSAFLQSSPFPIAPYL